MYCPKAFSLLVFVLSTHVVSNKLLSVSHTRAGSADVTFLKRIRYGWREKYFNCSPVSPP